ncbi:MAG: type II secretion system F family protein [Armatimonadetes bacterium]|nr:type II secretion system F family protein [Armatimonadota bacterium]MDW8027067.1 type II secretion system F family protein [Armatimonadota bacterium]
MLKRNPLERLPEFKQKNLGRGFSNQRVSSFLKRLITALGKFIPLGQRARLRALIHRAGLAGRIRPEEIFGLKLMGLIILPLVTLYFSFALKLSSFQAWSIALIAGSLGFLLPEIWLIRIAAKRSKLIVRNLPDFVDLLATCVEAGLALDAAIDRISKRFQGPLGEEFQRYLWEIQIGRPRNLALMSVAERTNCEDIRILAASLIQAELFGIPVANVLRAQSEAIREKRFQQARERARRAPLLMLPALAFCFCPVIFLLLFVPIYLRARQSGLLQFLGF